MQEKGIKLAELLNSNVFIYKFDFEMWPQNHTEDEEYIRPYNGSIFDLREAYRTIFHEERFKKIKDDEDSSKVYKVSYAINLLPQLGIHIDRNETTGKNELIIPESDMMCNFTSTEELDVYQTESLQQLIDFKWHEFSRKHQMVGLCFHFAYLLAILLFIFEVYLEKSGDSSR